jgi:hypothetical protein
MGIPSAGNAVATVFDQPEEAIRGAPGCAIMFNIKNTNYQSALYVLYIEH